MNIDYDNNTKLSLEIAPASKLLSSLSPKSLELSIVDNATIATINLETRNKNYPTDVLSFGLDSSDPASTIYLGALVMSSDKIIEAANQYGHSAQEEFMLLFIHGTLHLLGFDHERDQGEMRNREAKLIEELSLPASLIIRND